MKSKLSILLFLFTLNLYAQVPNNETFTLQDVATYQGWTVGTSVGLQRLFDDADSATFDSRYYPHYLVSGPNYNVQNSLINFRNYGGVDDGIPAPTATGATYVRRSAFTANWTEVTGATGYYLDVDIVPDFHHVVGGYTQLCAAGFGGATVSGLNADETHYYRVRAITPNGVSGYSNVCTLKTATNWFLPSLNELVAMKDNLKANSLGGFADAFYWSSSEAYAEYSYRVYMGDGTYVIYNNKYTLHRVRAVRTFRTSYNYSVGDAANTGHIFYKTDNGDGTYKYYEAASSDQSTGQAWSNVTGTAVTGTSSAVGTGRSNTALIIAQPGHTSSAAKLCSDLTLE